MKSYKLIAPAKINLYLEIIGARSDGYHELVMILQSIELADELVLKPTNGPVIEVHCNHPQLIDRKENLAYKAAKLMREEYPEAYSKYGGVEINLEKKIPIAAGLAGGSTDAAAVLVGLNMMWDLGLTQPELQELAAKIGSDIPFCVAGGTAIATGRGEQLDFINTPDQLWVVLGKHQNLAVSTPWAYKSYREAFGDSYVSDLESIKARASHIHSGPLVDGISHKDGETIAENLHNDLEKVVLPAYPEVAKLREAFAKANPLGTMMSGSGPTVFALCESQEQAEAIKTKVENEMADPDLGLWVTRLSANGIHVDS